MWLALWTQKCIREKRREAVGVGAVQGAAVLLGRKLLYFCPFESSHLRAWTLFIISDQIMKNSVSVKLVEVSHTARKH